MADTITSINSDDEYGDALARLDVIFQADKYTAEGDELERLVCLIEAYEDILFDIDEVADDG